MGSRLPTCPIPHWIHTFPLFVEAENLPNNGCDIFQIAAMSRDFIMVVSQYIVIARRRRWEGAMGGEMGGEMSGATPPATPAGRRPPAAVFVGPFSLCAYKSINFFLS